MGSSSLPASMSRPRPPTSCWRSATVGPSRVLCASNPLSTQDDVAAALVAEGIPVFAIRGEDPDSYYRHIHAVLDTRRRSPWTTAPTWPRCSTPIGGTSKSSAPPRRPPPESSASRRWRRTEPCAFPVVAVNDSATKHLFDNHYGTGQSAIDGIIRATNILMAGSTMAVIGYGDCGRGVAKRADGLGAKVIVVEVDPVRALSRPWTGTRS